METISYPPAAPAPKRSKGAGAIWLALAVPMLAILAATFIVPIGSLIYLSFFESQGPGSVGSDLTLVNYATFLGDPFFLRIVLNTFWLGGVVTLWCLIIGYPVSYYLARTHSRWRGMMLFIVVAPLLISAVVRNIGWFPILSNSGLVNTLLLKVGLIAQPIPLVSNMTGTVIGLVHALLPFMILTLTTVIQRIEPELEEAAANLGAGTLRTFLHVMLPLTMQGIVAGSLLVFTMAIAAYTTPVIMGGNRVLVMATFIGQQFRTVLDYAVGATAAAVLLALALMLSILTLKLGGGRTEMSR